METFIPTPTLTDYKSRGPNSKQTGSDNLFKQDLFCLQEDFHVRVSLSPEKEEAQKMTVTSGRRCFGLYERLVRHGSSLRTCVEYLLSSKEWYSSRSVLIWKEQVTTSRRLLYQLVPSTHRTEEIEYGLSLIPNAGMLPTPQASDAARKGADYARANRPRSGGDDLTTAIRRKSMLTTPSAARIDQMPRQVGKETGLRLQPAFAEWMMGFPLGWTNLSLPGRSTESSG